jgi:hypothetical protein
MDYDLPFYLSLFCVILYILSQVRKCSRVLLYILAANEALNIHMIKTPAKGLILLVMFAQELFDNTVISSLYCHIFGVCVTYKTGLDLIMEFIGPLCNLLQHFTNHYLRLDTLDF